MPFHFQLEGLLRVRRLLERQARERLGASMSRVSSLERRAADATQWVQNTERARAESAGLPAAELRFIESVLSQTQKAITNCERQKQAEEQQAAKLRAAYLGARRERKTVGTLREHALQQFSAEESRREQSALDEVFLGKLVRLRNGAQSLAETK
ncbi:MAG TPA: flagellar export protein FliJ [Candidatus Saccharimonadales bacterium]|nr:flagellar export protein FliJ [Candidatus Saccharimonadales bacterium]